MQSRESGTAAARSPPRLRWYNGEVNDSDPSSGAPPVLQRATRGAAAPGTAEAAVITAAAALAAGLTYQAPLTRDSPLRLLYLAAAGAATGCLELESQRGRFTLYLKRGVVEHASSDAPEDALGPFLLARGAVAADALAHAERLRGAHGGDLVSALASTAAFNPAAGYPLLQEHGGLVLTRALAATRGTCRWTPGAAAPASAFPLGSAWAVLCEAARRLDGDTVRALLGDRMHRAARPSRGRVELAQLRLTAHEARAASLLDGRSSPAALAASRPGDAQVVLRTALLLAETELLAFGAAVPAPGAAAAPPTAGRATPAPVAAGSGRAAPLPSSPLRGEVGGRPSPAVAPPPVAAGEQIAALEALHARLTGADHFAALGVARDATGAQVKTAYFDLARRYHPDAGAPGEPDRARQLRADIFARVGEAYRALGDDVARASYREQLEAGAVGDVDVSGILRAEETFRKATALVRSRQYAKALTALEEAIALNAAEPEFGVWLAWVQFLLSRDRLAQYRKSAAAIEAALRQVPRCLPGHLFLARMAKLMGDLSEAERHLERGLALDPDDAELAQERKFLRK